MSKSQNSMLVKSLNALVVTHSILVEDVDVDAEVTVIVKPLPIHPIQAIKMKELRIKDIAILQDLKATIKDDLLEPVLKPKDALGNETIKQIDLRNPQNHHYAESHYNQDGSQAEGSVPAGTYYNDQEAECFVPVGTVPKVGQGGMPSAEEQHDQYFVQGQFVQPREQQEMYPPPEDSYPPNDLYPPTDDQGYYPYNDASEHYHYYDEAH
ncbi:unnamed protein product [Cylindrotheca closterium]|uniref:Uncharacterized protein n=1 Tax=Cylindrotheca closterium TaxID=2856 RepID=A0AAD2FES0_9STRA|nr:unnamed protein product [Cylindrotheca closterium]